MNDTVGTATEAAMTADVPAGEARRRLEALLAELDQSLATLSPGEEQLRGGAGTADAGLDLADSGRAAAVVGAAREGRARVVAALERLDAGTYGLCVDCGTPLPRERLEARPEAARCVRCQARVESGR